MKDFIRISEQDIFYYVFYPDQLIADKKEFINAHKEEFKEQIEFCNALKEFKFASDNTTETFSFNQKPVELNLVELNAGVANNILTLAAASSELSKKIETKTFTDEKSQYLVRLVSTEEEKRLYVFSKAKNFKSARLTLLPSNKSYTVDSLDSSILIDTIENVEKISIEAIN